MKVWIDISNAPQALFFKPLIKKLEEVFVTARDYGPIADLLSGVEFELVGKHGGNDLEKKLIESSKRVLKLTKLVKEKKPEICVHKYSVEGARVAFGLRIPYIAVMDNEFAVSQNKLCLPFAEKVICPAAVPDEAVMEYNSNVIKFDGVCESANIQNLKIDRSILDDLNLDRNDKIIVLRSEPYNASYCEGSNILKKLIEKVKGKGQVVVIPRSKKERYPEAIVPEKTSDSLNLMYHSDLVISGGGSMAREAALLGTKSISCFEKSLAVNRYLQEKGLMEHIFPSEIGNKTFNVEKIREKKITKLGDPIKIILNEIK